MPAEPCARCGGVGFLVSRLGELAHAELCGCQARCPRCDNRRFVIVTDGGYDVATPCSCVGLSERIRLYNDAHIPGAYVDAHLASFKPGKNEVLEMARAAVSRYLNDADFTAARGLVLLGGPGAGKTHLMVGLLTEFTLKRAVACRFVDFYQLCARIRSTFDSRSEENEASIIEPLVGVPVLVLDDLGKGQGSAWELTVVDQLITRRYNAGRIILATSNFLPEGFVERRAEASGERRGGRATRYEPSLEERIDGRLVSRLRQNCELLVLQGVADYRTQKR